MKSKRVFPVLLVAATLIAATARGESPDVLLEKGIYYEETVGDLEKAIGIYQEIVDSAEANRQAAAQALYRLAECKLKSGQGIEANKLFRQVTEEYPEQTDLVARANQQIYGPPNLAPVPWEDGEILTNAVVMPTGANVGTAIYRAWFHNFEGKPAWHLELDIEIPVANQQQSTRTEVDPNTFYPIQGYRKDALGEYASRYAPDAVTVSWEANGETKQKEVEVDRIVYDNEQALCLIRRLPLAEGYTTTFPVLSAHSFIVVDVGIEVTGMETVTVGAGTFDCFVTLLKIIVNGSTVQRHTVWISKDEHRYPVKYDAESVVIQLTTIGRRNLDQQDAYYIDKEFGFQIWAPSGWSFGEFPFPEGLKAVQLIPSGGAGNLYAYGLVKREPEWNTVDDAHAKKMEIRKTFFQDYAIRPGSQRTFRVARCPAVSSVADYKEGGNPKVEYAVTFLCGDKVHNFAFRFPPDQFDSQKALCDEIVSKFQLLSSTE